MGIVVKWTTVQPVLQFLHVSRLHVNVLEESTGILSPEIFL